MSKIAPHVIQPSPESLDWARVAPAVKALDDTSALRVAERATVKIYRRYFANQDISRHGGGVVEEILTALGDAPATHIEVYNECYQRVGQGLERYVNFTSEAVIRLRQLRPDLTLVGYCFSVGQPESSDWEYLRQYEYGGATCVGIHEYWGEQGFSPWCALRHQTVHGWTSGDHPPFLITECGRDKVEGGKGGWRADGLTEDAYLAELLAYEQELLKDGYVIAATPFTGGPTPDWQNFNTDPIAGRLAAQATPLPPWGGPVADVDFGVPTVTSITTQHGPARPRTRGVMIHATRSGHQQTLQQEYQGTVAWFMGNNSLSSHVVVGPSEVTRMVHDADQAWHATENNLTFLSIEIAQPLPDTPYTDDQYKLAAAVTRAWCEEYDIPATRVFTQTTVGIIGHEDSEQGKRFGKSDPGHMFDWQRFLTLVNDGGAVPPSAFNRDQERDLLWTAAGRWEAAGYPWMGQGIKSLVAKDKGEG